MNSEDFKTIVEGCIANINGVLQKKSREYSSKDDKLHNFDKAKDLMRCKTKEFALLGMLNKHLVSVIDMIEKFEKTGELPTSGMIDEKIGDSINYFILLKACFYDDMSKAERKDPPIVEKIIEEAFNSSCFDNKRYTAEYLTEQIKQLERTRNVCFDKDKDIEMLKKEQAAIANSMYQNPRKRLVVENLRKMLKSLFVWLTDNNRFVDYEKIKKMLNKAELEDDSVPDEFIKDIIVAIEKLEIVSVEWYRLRDKIITEIVELILFPKYKVGDSVWYLISDLKEENWQVFSSSMQIEEIGLMLDTKEVYYKSLFGEIVAEQFCFKTKEEAQQECDKRNKNKQDIKDMFDTVSDLTTAMVVNTRKKAVVDNMQDKLKPIIEYLQIVEPKQYQYFSHLCFQEIQKHNSITDKVFYKTTIDFLNSLMLPDKDKLPQYKFRTIKQIRDSIVKRLRDELEKM